MPADSDVVGALLALARLQSTYGLSIGDLAAGKIAGQTASMSLSEKTMFDVAVQCLGNGRPDMALRWLEYLRDTSTNHSAIPPSSLHQAFARAFAQVVPRDVEITYTWTVTTTHLPCLSVFVSAFDSTNIILAVVLKLRTIYI